MTFFQPRPGRLHALNPLTKLTLACALVVVAFASATWLAPAALFLAVILPLAAWGGVLRALLKFTAAIALPTLLVVTLFQTLLHGGPDAWFTFGPLRATHEGLETGLLVGLRFTVLISAFLLLLHSTHPGALMTDLTQRGVSPSVAYLVGATVQLLPTMHNRAAAIVNAQRTRGLETEGSFLQRIRAVAPLVMPLVLSVLSSADERAMALESRAFRSGRARTSLADVPDTTAQHIVRLALIGLALGAVALRILSLT